MQAQISNILNSDEGKNIAINMMFLVMPKSKIDQVEKCSFPNAKCVL